MTVKMESKDDVLMHYGVVGMKWGVRRYQPYPSDSKRKGVYTGDKNVGAQPLKYKSPTTQKVLNAAIRTAAMLDPTGIAALAYNANSLNNMRKEYDSKDYDKDFTKEKLSELKRKPSGSSVEISSDVKAVNRTGSKGYVHNCLNCVAALEMRQRGYDVQARPRASGSGTDNYSKWFDGVEIKNAFAVRQPKESRKDWVNRGYAELTKALEANPDGSRGFVAFGWEGSKSGHTMSWKVGNGSVSFYDAQSGKNDTDRSLSFSDQNYLWGRLDNCTPTESITEVIESKGGKKK